ncbi:MAG: glycosyltransferase [Clostridia bacterium]|nr:glycosyltransferase [Clostridia bacterium]
MKFSVLTSVYKNDSPSAFKEAMDSLLCQTLMPDEIVLVRDGEVPAELQGAIDEYLVKYPEIFTYIPLEQNGGLGNALRIGCETARNSIAARMDSDDICLPDRFEKQIKFLKENPDIDIVSGTISEFNNDPSVITDYRVLPKAHGEIVELLKSRSPLNHVTVMFKRDSVMRAGNYQDFYLFEDWYLWIRMYLAGCKFANIDDVLVNVRVGTMSARRGGMKYYKSCKRLLKFMKQNKMIGFIKYTKLKTVRFIGYVLLPNKLRALMYKKLLRKKTT